jgi:hypothetical protein
MSNGIYRSTAEPLRFGLTWQERWKGVDGGLIQCWENGRCARAVSAAAVSAARRGELPPLDWKGGIAGQPNMKKKYGSLYYLATWLGLREEDLNIDPQAEVAVTCARTGIKVIFTAELSKLNSDSRDENS